MRPRFDSGVSFFGNRTAEVVSSNLIISTRLRQGYVWLCQRGWSRNLPAIAPAAAGLLLLAVQSASTNLHQTPFYSRPGNGTSSNLIESARIALSCDFTIVAECRSLSGS